MLNPFPRILAIETSTQPGSLAALTGGELLAEVRLPADLPTAKALFPAAASLLQQVGWTAADVGLVAVSLGPGSFTGLRIGVTLAKTWAYARSSQIIGIETPDVLAEQVESGGPRLWTVQDAQRRQLFVTGYRSRGNRWELDSGVEIVDRDAWLAGLEGPCCLTGEGLQPLLETPETLETRFPAEGGGASIAIAPREQWTPRAGALGQVACRMYEAGYRGDLWRLAPFYVRKSAAEEKYDQRQHSPERRV